MCLNSEHCFYSVYEYATEHRKHLNNHNNNNVDLYSARIHQLSGAQGALLPLLIRLIHHS